MNELRQRNGSAARALEFLILTSARTAEVAGTTWDEIDFQKKSWIVPAQRMKAGRAHRVPLTEQTLAVLSKMMAAPEGRSTFVFPGGKTNEPLSSNAMLALLERMGRSKITVHGFRSSFRDWAGECTNFPNEVIELALAHTIKDKTEAAYRRGDMIERRRALMSAWAEYCDRLQSEIVTPLPVPTVHSGRMVAS